MSSLKFRLAARLIPVRRPRPVSPRDDKPGFTSRRLSLIKINRSMARLGLLLGLLAALLFLSSTKLVLSRADHQSNPRHPDQSRFCDAGKASVLRGTMFSSRLLDRARLLSGAATARQLRKGMASTMEFRSDRINVEIDQKGRVTRIFCG
jgi:hypothetical protein